MLEHEGLEEQVRQFVAQTLSVKPERVRPDTRLGDDLGVDGDDGAEFMQAFARRFGVDISGFEGGQHFGPEASGDPLSCLWYSLVPRARPTLVAITIAGLAAAAREGQWRMPERDAA